MRGTNGEGDDSSKVWEAGKRSEPDTCHTIELLSSSVSTDGGKDAMGDFSGEESEKMTPSPPKRRKKGGRPPVDPAMRELEREERKRKAEEEKARKAAQREADREARLAAKEAEKRAKKLEKEAALRLKGSGKRAEQDMRVLLDRRVALHPSCKDVITTLARETLNSTISPGDHALAPRASILWQRAVPSRDGLSESLQDIPYVLVVLSGEQFVAEVDDEDLRGLLHASAQAHQGYTLSLLIVGLEHYLTTRERRDFQRDVAVSDGAFIRHRYDRAVATLGVEWPGVRHHLVPDAAAAAERIVQLTKALAQQPYKGATSFLESFGGPKRDTAAAKQLLVQCPIDGAERQTTFYALSYVPDVGPQIAHTLANRFSSLAGLTNYFLDPSRGQVDKEKELANMQRALGGGRLGPSAIRRLCGLLTTDDPFAPVRSLNSRE